MNSDDRHLDISENQFDLTDRKTIPFLDVSLSFLGVLYCTVI